MPETDPVPTAQTDPWQEPARGGHPDPRMLELPGLDQIRALLEGRIPSPPLSRLTGMHVVQADTGSAAFTLPLSDWLCAPQGAISIGPLTIPADAAMACAIQTTLPPGTPFTTSELSLRLLAPARPGQTLTAKGRLIHARRTIALSEASIVDEDDRLIAHGTTLCFMQPAISPAPRPPAELPAQAQDGDLTSGPDPWQRPALGQVIGQEVWERMSGLEVLLAQLAGSLPAPPISRFIGLRVSSAQEGSASFELPAGEWLTAPPPGRVQGGVVAVLAETALSAAIQTTLPAGTALAPVDLKVNYLRPLAADGRLALAQGKLVHAGRRLAVAQARVMNADGKAVAVATGSAMILAGRPASLATERPESLPGAED